MSPMLVVGSVAFDTVHNPLGTHRRLLGGSAVYAALSGSIFTTPQLVGVVGHDFPDSARQLLRSKNVDLEGLEVAKGETFHWEGRYTPDLSDRTTLRTDLNVFAEFSPKIPASFRNAPFVMLGNIDPVLQIEVLEQMHSPSLVVADTMNYWIEGKPVELRRLLARTHVLVINEQEARQLAEDHHIVRVARALRAMGPRFVVIKRGEYGALLFGDDGVFSAPAYPVEDVVDPTGAGDTFAGALLGYIAASATDPARVLRRAIIYGSTLASFCVEGIGVERLAAVKKSEVDERFAAFARLAHFASRDELAALDG